MFLEVPDEQSCCKIPCETPCRKVYGSFFYRDPQLLKNRENAIKKRKMCYTVLKSMIELFFQSSKQSFLIYNFDIFFISYFYLIASFQKNKYDIKNNKEGID